MAEIKIVKKKPIWPWILLVLIVLLAAILFFLYGDRLGNDVDDVDDVDDMTTELNDDYNSQPNDDMDRVSYEDSLNRDNSNRMAMSYRNSIADTTKLGVDNVSTKMALMNLSKAVEAKANEYQMQDSEALEMLREELRTVDSTLNVNQNGLDTKLFKTTGMRVLSVMDTLQRVQFPNLTDEVNEVKTAINEIQPSTTLAKQNKAVNSFFKESNDVLNRMNNN